METVVKKLNEIADQIAGEDVEDAKTVAEGLIAIGNAFGGEGEDTKSVVKALDYIKEHISGGGSSDFTTCSFTAINGAGITIYIPNIYIDGDYEFFTATMGTAPDAESTTRRVVLYKGQVYVDLENVASTSGNITYDDDEETYIITGDCTVTFSE